MAWVGELDKMAKTLLRKMLGTAIVIAAVGGAYMLGDSIGSDRGYNQGLELGRKEGIEQGRQEGSIQAREEAIWAFIDERENIVDGLKADTTQSWNHLMSALEYAGVVEGAFKILDDRKYFDGVHEYVYNL